jgi:hypothetical protein
LELLAVSLVVDVFYATHSALRILGSKSARAKMPWLILNDFVQWFPLLKINAFKNLTLLFCTKLLLWQNNGLGRSA